MKSALDKFLKLVLTSVVFLLWMVSGISFLLAFDPAVDTPAPTPSIGGPKLIIDNQLSYPVTVFDVIWSHAQGWYPTGPAAKEYSIEKKEVKELEQGNCWYSFNSGENVQCYWGHPGWRNGWLKIKAPEWKDSEPTFIDLAVGDKGKESGTINIVAGCSGDNSCECTLVDWEIKWAGSGWKIILTQRVEDYGCR